LLHKGNINIL